MPRKLLSLVFLALACSAQPKYLTTEPGVWKPWKFTAIPSVRSNRGTTPAEVKAFEAKLLELNAILRKAPSAATPIGFSVETWGNLSDHLPFDVSPQPAGRAVPLAGALSFGAFPIFEYERDGKPIRSDTGETVLLEFHVNELQPWLTGSQKPAEWAALDTDATFQPQQTGTFAGHPRYGDILVIKKRADSIWSPVSLEDALQLTITASRRAGTNPSEAAKLGAAEAQLKALAPAQRSAAACYSQAAPHLRDVNAPAVDCRPIVRPNWSYFQRNLPRSAPQVLIISTLSRCLDTKIWDNPAGCRANLKLIETLDMAAVLAWLAP